VFGSGVAYSSVSLGAPKLLAAAETTEIAKPAARCNSRPLIA
jgi:hypothetical protein